MRIESVQIENFRAFANETVRLSNYTSLVGRNGSGKSTVLHALNLFFRQNRDSQTDLVRLSEADFHHRRTDTPIRVTVTFDDLSDAAKHDLSDYARQGRLTVSAVAKYDSGSGTAEVRQYGSRLGFDDFRPYFELEKQGASAADLKAQYAKLRSTHADLPAVTVKADMAAALRTYESEHPDGCVLIESEDQFYGVSKGVNRLAPHLQWVFVSASKDATEEADEAKNSALGVLLARTVRSKIDFSDKILQLRREAEASYQVILDAEQESLNELSESLERTLQSWAHPEAEAKVEWNRDASKSVRVEEPAATVRLGERGFDGELARFGLGLQRSYLLALLLELSNLPAESQPTLIMGIEEPELYQHPPQARHLSEVLASLADGVSGQVVCCTHSPLFVPPCDFEAVRLVRDSGTPRHSIVSSVDYSSLASRLDAAGEGLLNDTAMCAKLAPILTPTQNEMFFCDRLILVEGTEDVAHLSSCVELLGLRSDFRRFGCHIVPVGGKRALIKPLAIALELGLPVFVVFDADTDTTRADHVTLHKKDNLALLKLLNAAEADEWPKAHLWGSNYCAWSTNLTDVVNADIADWQKYREEAAKAYGHCGGMEKNPMSIAYCHELAFADEHKSEQLERAARLILSWAEADDRDDGGEDNQQASSATPTEVQA